MKMVIKKRYLAVPVSYMAQNKRLLFRINEKLIMDLVIKLDCFNPDMVQYVDMKRFLGQEVSVFIEPSMDFTLDQTDKIDDTNLYTEKYRPVAHFTASRGWINDPNGLVWANGRYHLFFQYNPVGIDWGNMHWGHAVSTDLIHWEQQDIALFPDELGTMFSGSAIVDIGNLTGLKETDQDVILLYYTAAGGTSRQSDGQPFTQCLAYSTDGGVTFRKYAGNPLIRERVSQNRDPKIIYHAASKTYYMALFLVGNRYALLVSDNLLDWKWKQEIVLPEDGECPDFYPLPLDGDGSEYWVLSGASDRYMVGTIAPDGCFQSLQSAKRLHYGKNSYAAQTFSGVADGRILRIAWNTYPIPASPFNCALCIPMEMSLRTINGEKKLCALPVKEIENLYLRQETLGETVLEGGGSLTSCLSGKAQDIWLRLASENDAPFHLALLGLDMEICPMENLLKCNESALPLFTNGDVVELRMITDTNAVEIFAAQGEAFLCIGHVADYNLNRLTITAGDKKLTLCEASISELESIWTGK